MQSSTTADMVFGVHHIVWYLSQFLVLEPGDVINTGTPFGVGMGQQPQRYLTAGDVMELTVERLGHQRQQAVQQSTEARFAGSSLRAGCRVT